MAHIFPRETAVRFTLVSVIVFACAALTRAEDAIAPSIDVETGVLWQAGHNTPLSYRLVPTQLSWRSRPVHFLRRDFESGASLVVRHRLTLLTTWIQDGPESHYVALAGSPSIELWNKTRTTSHFGGAGGGFGWVDSRGVRGGQGQDFTFNWFARAGVERMVRPNFRVMAGVMFQHLSNLGQTNPNPGIDAVGFTLGGSWSY